MNENPIINNFLFSVKNLCLVNDNLVLILMAKIIKKINHNIEDMSIIKRKGVFIRDSKYRGPGSFGTRGKMLVWLLVVSI
jgi:hypothetical protein